MKIIIADLAGLVGLPNKTISQKIKDSLSSCIENYSEDFVQDMSHISQAANYAGNIAVDEIVHLKDNLYRCDYSYDWAIAWTCSGTQEAGRVKEKVRFTVNDNGELDFKFLQLDM
ncbi:hypothetical protein [Thiomicrorhabdus sp. Kp2]|uniref:hypothetical protein n=1 Tax=Thiomicrorhabdus sp. Kp2 TaxID=1123518 RepID=UPI0004129C03|nr:hypothetical protein [Thiomicrorhabdus sp. Kp2]